MALRTLENRAVILRNISNHQENNALKAVCQNIIANPLKASIFYENEAGTNTKTFSPFTLFADACVADAKDAVIFNKLVAQENFR